MSLNDTKEPRQLHHPYDVIPIHVTADGWRMIHNALKSAASVALQNALRLEVSDKARGVFEFQVKAYADLAAEVENGFNRTPSLLLAGGEHARLVAVGDCLKDERRRAAEEDRLELILRAGLSGQDRNAPEADPKGRGVGPRVGSPGDPRD